MKEQSLLTDGQQLAIKLGRIVSLASTWTKKGESLTSNLQRGKSESSFKKHQIIRLTGSTRSSWRAPRFG